MAAVLLPMSCFRLPPGGPKIAKTRWSGFFLLFSSTLPGLLDNWSPSCHAGLEKMSNPKDIPKDLLGIGFFWEFFCWDWSLTKWKLMFLLESACWTQLEKCVDSIGRESLLKYQFFQQCRIPRIRKKRKITELLRFYHPWKGISAFFRYPGMPRWPSRPVGILGHGAPWWP